MIEQLFGSKTRVKLLHLFFSNPNRSFYVREITRKIDEQINSVRRELANLLSIGIISSDSNNNRLYYEVSQKYQHYEALKSIFTHMEESEHIQPNDQEKDFRDLGLVKIVYLLGKFVREPNHPVDLLIVGDVNQTKLDKLISKIEKENQFEVNYAVMSENDFIYRKRISDRFIIKVIEAKKTTIVNDLEDINEIQKTKKVKKKE